MITKKELVFWSAVWIILTLIFSNSTASFTVSFFFVTMLMPVILATSIFFNRFLIPQFLLRDKRIKFSLYLIYMLIVSVYLELLVMVLSFVILADYQIQNLGQIAGDIYQLTIILYLIVLVEGLILSIRKLREQSNQVEEFQSQLSQLKKKEISVRSNRRNVIIQLSDITYIESLGDYVKIHNSNNSIVTKEKISSLGERLPDSFVRIHRSFIVNRGRISGFNKESVELENMSLPIGRKYKKAAEELLNQKAIV